MADLTEKDKLEKARDQRERERERKTGTYFSGDGETKPVEPDEEETGEPIMPLAEDDFKELSAKLIKTRERYERASQQVDESSDDLDKQRDKRVRLFKQYAAVAEEVIRRVRAELENPIVNPLKVP